MTTEERQRRRDEPSSSAVDAENDDPLLASSPVAYFDDALPPRLLDALRKDAEGLACCSNFWIPKGVLEGKEPPLAAFEQAAAELARRCLVRKGKSDSLHPILSVFDDESELAVEGVEAWCQVYEGGRGLDPHYDKDEEASARGERPLRHPRVSSVVYLNGSRDGDEGRRRLGATVVVNQRLHPRSGAPLPKVATSSTLLWPTRGSAAFFDGRLAHCVLSSPGAVDGGARPTSRPPPFDETKRATVLFNFWSGEKPPGGVLRVTEGDIEAAGLTRPVCLAADGGEGEEGESRRVAPVAVEVAGGTETRLHLLDDLLGAARNHPVVVVSHAGYELVEAEVHEGGEEGGKEKGEPRSQVVFIPVSESDSD